MDSMERPHEYIFVDEAGFNLAKRRRRGRNIIGQRAIVEVPGQRGGNVTPCAAISNGGFSTIMQPWGHITLTIFLHFWVVFGMFCLNVSSRIISRQCILSMLWFGTMSAFTVVSEYVSGSTSTSNS